MTEGPAPTDPRWPRLLSLAVHELRTPVTVVAGYISMLLKERAGPLSETQRRMLEESQKSTSRLSALIAELSELAKLEDGDIVLNLSDVDLGAVIKDAAASLTPLPNPAVTVTVDTEVPGASVRGDPVRLRAALGSVFFAVARELVASTQLLVRVRPAADSGPRGFRISVADDRHIVAVDATGADNLGTFDEWRGGCGLSLAIARRVIAAHGGFVRSPAGDPKSGAVVFLPEP